MEKKIEFDAQIDVEAAEYTKTQMDGNARYALLGFLQKDDTEDTSPGKKAVFHVTLSPACPERSSQEPDYKAMWEDLQSEADVHYRKALKRRH